MVVYYYQRDNPMHEKFNSIQMLFWWMGMNYTMIEIQNLITNQALEVILTDKYINIDGRGME